MVSILMAVYNAAPYLPLAIESVLCQCIPDWELLCVDDGSHDESLRILRDYASRDMRIKVFSDYGNQGPAKARNVALQRAVGDYVMMLDADDWLSCDALEKAETVFRQHPQADCVLLSLVEEYPDCHCLYQMEAHPGDVFSGHEAFRLSLDWCLHGLYLVRRELHQRYPYDDSCRLHSDDNTTRIHYLHSREVHLCAGEYHYRKREDSLSYVVGLGHFGYLDANLSMSRLLQQELSEGACVTSEDVAFYEAYRWRQYVDKHWYLFLHRRQFAKEEKLLIREKLREFYFSFSQGYSSAFGFRRYRKYNHFLLQEWLYFRLRYVFNPLLVRLKKMF